ncbi:MAG: hypothetical protein M1836_002424 [Candelina mexicana]|nr:MAG: hypothetical protein M1836_002424 [Candelina mexicana]
MLTIVADSRAIARHLVIKHIGQGTQLMPDPNELKAVALFEQCALVEVDQFDKFATPLLIEVVLKPGLSPKTKLIKEATEMLNTKLDVFNRILSEQAYMCGGTFSLVDIFYVPAMMHLTKYEISFVNNRPN